MRFLKRVFAPKEVRVALNILDEVGLEFGGEAFGMVRNLIEKAFLEDYNLVVSAAKEGMPPRQRVYVAIANVAGDHVESGQYHLYRGVLNPLGPGPELLRLHGAAIDKLVQIGAIGHKDGEAHKAAIAESIKSVG